MDYVDLSTIMIAWWLLRLSANLLLPPKGEFLKPNPYSQLSDRSFWRSAVAQHNFLQISGLWRAKFLLSPDDRIITAGSCFAQHIGTALKERGFNWYDAEPAPVNHNVAQPKPDVLSLVDQRAFNYGVFSFRTGNIYTTSLLLQWIDWATGERAASDEVWQDGERFFDPFRPVVEPEGFSSALEVLTSRTGTIEAVDRAIRNCSLFIFTLGLTERWQNKVTGVEYPMCPGTAAGAFNPDEHVFDNMNYEQVKLTLSEAIRKARAINQDCRFLITVSPVPLTATASDQHVLLATTYSKSTLRAAAADVAQAYDFVDYFPSYEIISSFPYRGTFFEPNLRSVAPEGVAHVMQHFFAGMQAGTVTPSLNGEPPAILDGVDDAAVACEEALLEAFGKRDA
tara:strand:+ start:23119 stop:24306 length:1188 start_codon:yes stop_codon:yes gene_type:complete